MSSDPRLVPQPGHGEQPLAQLLRERALESSPRLLAGQAAAGAALNGLLAVVQPDRWGLALLGALTVGLHAIWSMSVQRTDAMESSEASDASDVRTRVWRRVRRVTALAGSLSALALLWTGSVLLLGRWIS